MTDDKKYHRFDVSYNELSLLQDLLQVEILIQVILAIKHTTTNETMEKLAPAYLAQFNAADRALSAKAVKALRLFEDFRSFDDNLLDLKDIFLKSNTNKNQLFAVIMSTLQLKFYKSLIDVTSKEKDAIAPTIAQKVGQLGDGLCSRIEMGLAKMYTKEEVNSIYTNFKQGGTLDPQQPAPAQDEVKSDFKDELQINILGKKGLA